MPHEGQRPPFEGWPLPFKGRRPPFEGQCRPFVSKTAQDDPLEPPAVNPELRDGDAVAQEHRHHVGEALPETGLGVNVSRRPGKAVGRQDFVEQDSHFVAEMAALACHELIACGGSRAAEEHGRSINVGAPLVGALRRAATRAAPT